MIIHKIKKQEILEYTLGGIYFLTLIVSNISNYSLTYTLLKFGSSLTLISVFVFYIYLTHKKLTEFHKSNMFRRTAFLVIYITIYLAITITYSVNKNFGFQKISNLLIALYPLIYITLFIVYYKLYRIYQCILTEIIFIGVVSGIVIILIYPFNFQSVYAFSILRWSHVVYGRFISLGSLLLFFAYCTEDNKRKAKYYLVLSFFFLFISFYSGYRAGFLSSIFIIITFFFTGKYVKAKSTVFLLISSITIIFFLILSLLNNLIIDRYEDLLDINYGSVAARVDAWTVAVRSFSDNIFWGTGFGGFNHNYGTNTIGIIIKYPHNIILEGFTELGLIGGVGLIVLIYKIIKSGFGFNRYVGYFLLYALLISLTSKDLTTNNFFFIGISLIFLHKNYEA